MLPDIVNSASPNLISPRGGNKKCEVALALVDSGFWIFRVKAEQKTPYRTGWQEEATRDPKVVRAWYQENHKLNIGIFTEKFRDNEALIVVDVDNKNKTSGNGTIIELELSGYDLPDTFTVETPNDGRHLYFRTPAAVKGGAGARGGLGEGVDIRSRGQYVVGPGSILDAPTAKYRAKFGVQIAPAPAWLVERCGIAPAKPALSAVPPLSLSLVPINEDRAASRGKDYLLNHCPPATPGARNHAAYLAAARLKDYGTPEKEAVLLMLEHWPCEPMLDRAELEAAVANAYRYGQEPLGILAPEVEFTPILPEAVEAKAPDGAKQLHPFEVLNKEYAFVVTGGGHHIIWETTDPKGNPCVEHLGVDTFHLKLAAYTMACGDGAKPVSKLWITDPKRRSYDGLCFMPGQTAPARYYNLFRGFAFKLPDPDATPSFEAQSALNALLEHAEANICRGDKNLFRWVMGFFAHMIQRPWEKPLVALVLRGKKGTGKNVFIETFGALLGSNFRLTADSRYLLGNFNSHLENNLLFALDEAFWSGDKKADGQIKNLITGTQHLIERKGQEPYTVDNCSRIVIMGNDAWLVPASHDERRFAVLDVGDGRKQDREFFKAMLKGMRAGGYQLLLRYLTDYDLKGLDVNEAPQTTALQEQKLASLDPFYQWWLDNLMEGKIPGDFEEGWPEQVDKNRIREAYLRYCRERNIHGRMPEETSLGRMLSNCCASVVSNQKRRDGRNTFNVYRFQSLEQCRRDWEVFIGHMTTWD